MKRLKLCLMRKLYLFIYIDAAIDIMQLVVLSIFIFRLPVRMFVLDVP